MPETESYEASPIGASADGVAASAATASAGGVAASADGVAASTTTASADGVAVCADGVAACADGVAASASTASAGPVQPSPRRKIGLKKKLTPKKLAVVPASPTANTRSKKKLQVE